ncbi:CU044_2847 family protein [Nonomuraea sp. NPDC049269]
MERLVEFQSDGGETLLVEVHDLPASDGAARRGWGSRPTAQEADRSFEQAVERIRPAAQAVINRLRLLSDAPDEINVEFGLGLSAEAGAFIAKTSGSANFKISLTWHRSKQGNE